MKNLVKMAPWIMALAAVAFFEWLRGRLRRD